MKYSAADIETIRKSGIFDEHWYLKEYPDVAHLGMDPIEHYLWLGWRLGRDPSPSFSTSSYLETNRDVARHGINPLLHVVRTGKAENRKTAAVTRNISSASAKRRVAVFAHYDAEGAVQPYVQHYLKALKSVSQHVVFVSDCAVAPSALKSIEDLIDHAIPGRHEEYDFGSYKRGYLYAREQGWLSSADALILCNDSCFGPLTDFDSLFAEMDAKACDFWGITASNLYNFHLQSYFLSFTRRVFEHPTFRSFFTNVTRQPTVRDVIMNYELRLTPMLAEAGFRPAALISDLPEKADAPSNERRHIEHYPIWLMQRGSPLVKVKALKKPGCNSQGIGQTLEEIRARSTTLASLIETALERGAGNPKAVAFSIIMATKDRAYCVTEAIDSVLKQTHTNFELIIVDDGSTDGTQELIQTKYENELKAGKIKFIRSANPRGVSAARNIGLRNASNAWITYVDSDNVIREHFLSLFAQQIVLDPAVRVLYAKLRRNEDGHVTGKPFDYNALTQGNYIDLGVFAHHRACYESLGGFDETLKRLVDWDLILRYTKKFKPTFIDRIILDYSNVSSSVRPRISTCECLVTARIAVQKRYTSRPVVSTIVPSYNQENYIVQTLKSALAQKGDFIHEVIAADDGSTDATHRLIAAAKASNSHIIRDISTGQNVGISRNFERAIDASLGDYIAILEGDDYWTDEKKLAEQVRFLEENADCSMVFSKINVLNVTSNKMATLERQDSLRTNKLTGDDFLAHPTLNLIANFSCCMFRAHLLKRAPKAVFSPRINEISVAFYFEQHGKIGFIDRAMSVYRQHPQGVWTGKSKKDQLINGLEIRRSALGIAHERHRAALQRIIDEKYLMPLAKMNEDAPSDAPPGGVLALARSASH